MAENSKIEWTHHTFNPWIGCQKVGPGCDHCYAEAMMADRYGRVEWGPHGSRSRTSAANWRKPLAWDRAASLAGRRDRVFCASLADVFDNHGSITSGWRGDLWHLIHRTPNLDWMLLTKRPGNIPDMLPDGFGAPAWGDGWPNVWLGCTITSREEMLRDALKLQRVPAQVRFWSVEPMLGAFGVIDRWMLPDLVIVGGESGPGARPMHPDWARGLRDQCSDAAVPFFFKQWGEWGPGSVLMGTGEPVFRAFPDFQTWVNKAPTWVNGGACYDAAGRRCRIGADFMRARDEGTFPVTVIHKVGKKAAGRRLDGRTWDQMPGVAA